MLQKALQASGLKHTKHLDMFSQHICSSWQKPNPYILPRSVCLTICNKRDFFLNRGFYIFLYALLGSSPYALIPSSKASSNDVPDHHVIAIADSSLGSGVRTRQYHRLSNQIPRTFEMQPQGTSKERHENIYHDQLWKQIQDPLF